VRAAALAVCATLACAAAPAAAAEPDAAVIGPAALEPLLEAARAKGLSVVVIAPEQAPVAPSVPPAPSAGAALAILAGQIAKRIQGLVADMSAPGWPEPSSDPAKPLLNGMLTVLGLLGGLAIARRAGMGFRHGSGFEGDTAPSGRPGRPVRIGRALVGILIAAVAAMILPFVVHGPGSKTIELVGQITEFYLRCAVVYLIAAPLLERAQERLGGSDVPFDPARLDRDLRIALTATFIFASAALILSFMYPDWAVLTLARLAFVSVVAALAMLLVFRHRGAIAVFASNILGRRLRNAAGSAWTVVAGYVVIAWLIACVRILLSMPDAADVIIAPVAAILIGVAVYHLFLFLASLVLHRHVGVASGADGLPRTGIDLVRWPHRIGRALGIAAALVLAVERLGFALTRADGSLGFVPTAVIVTLFAYAIWAYASEAIDRRIALELAPEPALDPASDSGEAEGAPGRSRLATLLPLFRNALLVTVVFLAALMLLHEAGVNIAPIFASAGIVGLAIGFGAQSLVRDIISGLFFLLDDAFRLGEYIETGGLKGSVERISVRSMQLRHHNGPLNTVPFGGMNDLTNYSRDWVIMKLPIKLVLHTDLERVRKLVKKLGQSLLEDPVVGHKFLEPLKSQGVLSIDNWGITIRIKFKTRPGDQFTVRRVVYSKLHEMFEQEGIEFAGRDVRIKVDGSSGAATPERPALAAVAAALQDEGAPQGLPGAKSA
jgi:moderate conductance mechanosensitive channel